LSGAAIKQGQVRLNSLHVLLVTDDPGLVTGMSAALSDQPAVGRVEQLKPGVPWSDTWRSPDLVILDSSELPDARSQLAADRFSDSMILRVRDDDRGLEVESHRLPGGAHGYICREDLDTVAPAVLALVALSASRD
jgi:DNA-binding NarL/FixJ family response regulator